MARPKIEPGAVIDGFSIGECVHNGGMATLWSVSHSGIEVHPASDPIFIRWPTTV